MSNGRARLGCSFVFWNIPIKLREAGRCEQCPSLDRDGGTEPFMTDALGILRLATLGVPVSPLLLAEKLDLPDYISCLPQFGGS